MLLNLANAAASGNKTAAVPATSCGCAVVDSMQWGKLGCDLRSVADSLNSAKCQVEICIFFFLFSHLLKIN
jgi:hypothetical protein